MANTKNNTYKQTSIGLIPNDWEVNTLGEIVNEKRPITYGIVQTGEPVKNGVKCLRVVDIIDGKINPVNLISTSIEISNGYKRTILIEGDLVIALRGKIGELAIIDKNLVGANLTRGVGLIALKKEYYNEFFRQQLISDSGRKLLESKLNGSALQELSISVLRSLPVLIPPLPEQKAIAHILGLMDTAINTNNQLIAQKEQRKKWLMQNLLTGKKRLKGFSEEWKEVKLGEIGEVITGLTYSPENIVENNGVLVLRSSNIQNGVISLSDKVYVSVNEGDFNPLKLNDILICVRNGSKALIGKNALITENEVGKAFGAFMAVFRSKYNDYLFQIFNSDFYYKEVQKNLGATINSINNSDLRLFKIPFPSIKEQIAIAQILQAADKEIQLLKAKTDKLKEQKKGLMQVLLTGKKRLKIIND